ncbi:MAG TPA: hypothetical protein VFW11_03225 [Cyclobacteriaceae bacterium]|nr:hypothetical protein [Cyclobacteriaceae bacterium]
MKHRSFYVILLILVFLDSVLLASPNLIGKVGLLIYKYYYLRTFSRTLVTVTLVCGAFSLITFCIQMLRDKLLIKRNVAVFFLSLLLLIVILIYARIIIDFSSWSYSHTGWRFRLGAYLLPLIVIYIITYTMVTLKRDEYVMTNVDQSNGINKTDDLTDSPK